MLWAIWHLGEPLWLQDQRSLVRQAHRWRYSQVSLPKSLEDKKHGNDRKLTLTTIQKSNIILTSIFKQGVGIRNGIGSFRMCRSLCTAHIGVFRPNWINPTYANENRSLAPLRSLCALVITRGVDIPFGQRKRLPKRRAWFLKQFIMVVLEIIFLESTKVKLTKGYNFIDR